MLKQGSMKKMKVGKSMKRVMFRFRRKKNVVLPSKEEREESSWPLDEIHEDNKCESSNDDNVKKDDDIKS